MGDYHDEVRIPDHAILTLLSGGTVTLDGVAIVPCDGASAKIRLAKDGEDAGVTARSVVDADGSPIRMEVSDV